MNDHGVTILVAGITWLCGLVTGLGLGHARARSWIARHGCYLCQHKWANPVEWY
jgi:hypothetical protein